MTLTIVDFDDHSVVLPESFLDADGRIASPERTVEMTLEFANPWHDEEGKFAPKGMGTTSPAGAAPQAAPATAPQSVGASVKERVVKAFQAGSQTRSFSAHEAQHVQQDFKEWSDRMGADFQADQGKMIAEAAIADVASGSKGLIAATKQGFAGIISYTMFDAETTGRGHPVYEIEHLGSTGIAPGVGTQLTAQVMRQASINKAGVQLTVASNESAPAFWKSLGFEPGGAAGNFAEMSPAQVAQWVKDMDGA